jgi:hypothetical protein
MSIFTSSRNLKGQSFAHGLAPFDPLSLDSDEFVETSRLSILIDEEGEVNVSGPVRLFAGTDPIDSDEIPTFSKGNKFVAGLEKVLPGGRPEPWPPPARRHARQIVTAAGVGLHNVTAKVRWLC